MSRMNSSPRLSNHFTSVTPPIPKKPSTLHVQEKEIPVLPDKPEFIDTNEPQIEEDTQEEFYNEEQIDTTEPALDNEITEQNYHEQENYDEYINEDKEGDNKEEEIEENENDGGYIAQLNKSLPPIPSLEIGEPLVKSDTVVEEIEEQEENLIVEENQNYENEEIDTKQEEEEEEQKLPPPIPKKPEIPEKPKPVDIRESLGTY